MIVTERTKLSSLFAFVFVPLQEHVMSLAGKLSEEVAEGGDNFSTGQRQVRKIHLRLLQS